MTITGNRAGAAPSARLYPSTTVTFDGDLDLIAIEYAMNGEPVTLTIPEKIHAAKLLDERGLDPTEIARRVDSTRDTVSGWKDRGWTPPRKRSGYRVESDPIDIGGASHGASGYNRGCRCRICRAGSTAAARAYRERKKNAAAAA